MPLNGFRATTEVCGYGSRLAPPPSLFEATADKSLGRDDGGNRGRRSCFLRAVASARLPAEELPEQVAGRPASLVRRAGVVLRRRGRVIRRGRRRGVAVAAGTQALLDQVAQGLAELAAERI